MENAGLGFALIAAGAIWAPYLLHLLFALGLTAITLHAHAQTQGRGWQLLGVAAVLQLLRQLASAYPTYLLTQHAWGEYGKLAAFSGATGFLVNLVVSILTLVGLLALLSEHRRLLGRPS